MTSVDNPFHVVLEQNSRIIKIDVQNERSGGTEIKIDIQKNAANKGSEDSKIRIGIRNKMSGVIIQEALVYETNTLEEILEAYEYDIGGSTFERPVATFLNRRTGEVYHGLDKTVEEFGLLEGDVLEVWYGNIN